jgi:Lysophospholipase L1 and related esterases
MPSEFDQEVEALRERSRAMGTQQKLVLFYGSSSFTLWADIERHFPDYKIANHGFGGSTLEDCLSYFDQLVSEFNPGAIILYAGDNDLANGSTPEQVLARLDAFFDRKRRAMGNVPVAYVSIKVSPARFGIMHRIAYTNLIIERHLRDAPDAHFVDITRRMTGRGLIPFLNYYASDPLHMNRDGYRILGKSIAEFLAARIDAGDDLRRASSERAAGTPAWAEEEEAGCGADATHG